jgi:LruC domain-containing protein
LQYERFNSDGTSVIEPATSLAAGLSEETPGSWMVRIDDVFPSTKAALPPSGAEGGYTNTWFAQQTTAPASVRFLVTFDRSLATASIGLPPFDPYLSVKHLDGLYDIHRPGMTGFAGRPSGLPVEKGPASFLDPNGYAFALLVPYDWRYPLESVQIESGGRGLPKPYASFEPWRKSGGATNASWYATPAVSTTACVTNSLSSQVRARPWTIVSK